MERNAACFLAFVSLCTLYIAFSLVWGFLFCFLFSFDYMPSLNTFQNCVYIRYNREVAQCTSKIISCVSIETLSSDPRIYVKGWAWMHVCCVCKGRDRKISRLVGCQPSSRFSETTFQRNIYNTYTLHSHACVYVSFYTLLLCITSSCLHRGSQ